MHCFTVYMLLQTHTILSYVYFFFKKKIKWWIFVDRSRIVWKLIMMHWCKMENCTYIFFFCFVFLYAIMIQMQFPWSDHSTLYFKGPCAQKINQNCMSGVNGDSIGSKCVKGKGEPLTNHLSFLWVHLNCICLFKQVKCF